MLSQAICKNSFIIYDMNHEHVFNMKIQIELQRGFPSMIIIMFCHLFSTKKFFANDDIKMFFDCTTSEIIGLKESHDDNITCL